MGFTAKVAFVRLLHSMKKYEKAFALSARIIFAVVVHFLSEADEAEVDDEKNEKNEIASAKAVSKPAGKTW